MLIISDDGNQASRADLELTYDVTNSEVILGLPSVGPSVIMSSLHLATYTGFRDLSQRRMQEYGIETATSGSALDVAQSFFHFKSFNSSG